VHANKATAVGVKEVNLGMPTSLIDLVDLKAGRAQRSDGVSKRRAH
jgi:hypothetical protein